MDGEVKKKCATSCVCITNIENNCGHVLWLKWKSKVVEMFFLDVNHAYNKHEIAVVLNKDMKKL